MNKTKISAKIVADSISPQGDRLISVLCTFPRIILAEVNTHRMLSKNTSSSRAIPFLKMVEAVKNDPFIPIAWQKEHKGMQGSEYITSLDEIEPRINDWLDAKNDAVKRAKYLNDMGVTKQLCNRLLEPFMWTTMLITGSKEGWDNFFNLRCPQYSFGSNTNDPKTWKSKKDAIKDFPDWVSRNDFYWNTINKGQAEIHMMTLAECIYDAVNESTPKQLQAGEWHIPFGDRVESLITNNHIERFQQNSMIAGYINSISNVDKVKISTAMAAHTSYTIVGGEAVKSYEKWIELHDKLIAYDPPHSSPMEHCARAMSEIEYTGSKKTGYSTIKGGQDDGKGYGWCNNFKGFIPYRYFIDNNLTF